LPISSLGRYNWATNSFAFLMSRFREPFVPPQSKITSTRPWMV